MTQRRRALGMSVAGGALGCLSLICAWLSCAPIALPDGDRRMMLGALTTNVILPTYDDVAARATDLRVAIAGFVADPTDATLEPARQNWREARLPWKEAEAFAFGPVTEQRLGVALDQSPVEYAYVEAEIAGPAELNAAYVETLGANRKGFHAIEYLIFGAVPTAGGPQPTESEILAAFAGDTAPAVRRRTFLVALGENLELKATEIRAAWTPEAGGYATRFSKPGAVGAHPTVKAAIDTVVNETVFLSELIADAKIGKPLGLPTGGAPQPSLAESVPSDNAISDMAANIRGIRNLFLGTRDGTAGTGLSSLVAKKSASIAAATGAAIENAAATIDAIPRPYVASLVGEPATVQAAYAAVKNLKVILATDVLGILGATLKFNDNDGD